MYRIGENHFLQHAARDQRFGSKPGIKNSAVYIPVHGHRRPGSHPDDHSHGKLTNGTQTITLRTYTATSGAQNTVDLSSVWLPLLSGTHVLTITATDSAGGSATRKITFSRTVSRIAAARAFNTDALVQKVFVSLYPATIPADATLHLEVTNNPFDTSPVWVDITDKANRLVHVFTNTTAAKGYGLGYRFYITKGTQEIEITQATIRFA